MCYALADIDAHQDVGKLPPFLLSPEITFEPDERNYPVLVEYPGHERRVSAWSHFIDLIANVAVFAVTNIWSICMNLTD